MGSDDTGMNRMVAYNSKWRGFTLAELVVAMEIIMILVGIGVPIFSNVLKNHRLKQVKEQELAAKAAAVSAFYAGYDSKGNVVDITENKSGYCTFLYDEANGAVYVVNSNCGVSGFSGTTIESYGLKISNSEDYTKQVILVTFDGRYHQKVTKNPPNGDESRGACQEPIIKVSWVSAPSLIKGA